MNHASAEWILSLGKIFDSSCFFELIFIFQNVALN